MGGTDDDDGGAYISMYVCTPLVEKSLLRIGSLELGSLA